MKRLAGLVLALLTLAFCLVLLGGSATAAGDEDVLVVPKVIDTGDDDGPALSGALDLKDVDLGTAITECPQAGEPIDKSPKPLDL
jgi:hypothetical protein